MNLPFWQCSWCGRFYNAAGYLPDQQIPARQVSHGICRGCAQAVIRNLEKQAPAPSFPIDYQHFGAQ